MSGSLAFQILELQPRESQMPGHGEFQLIDWIEQRSFRHPQVSVGIGDDAAVMAPTPGEDLLVTTDMLMDGRHFLLNQATPEKIGHKSLGVNISDIAAMGGRPVAAFVSWALPRSGGQRLAEGLFRGMSALAQRFGISIAGGDTNSWDGPLVINITLIGETIERRRILRSGANVGDVIFVSGPLGGSLKGRHLEVAPRVAEAQELVRRRAASAMLDISDGVASDLRHILNQSRVGATLDAAAIPVHPDVDAGLSASERIRHALTDGEDFELLWTAPPAAAEALVTHPPSNWRPIRIGVIEEQLECRLRTASGLESLPMGGWEHTLD